MKVYTNYFSLVFLKLKIQKLFADIMQSVELSPIVYFDNNSYS